MTHAFVSYSTLCILAVVIHHASSDIEIHNKSSNYITSFSSDMIFGSDYADPLQGLVILADPPDACEPIKTIDFCCNMTFSKFVLVAGSVSPNCTFEQKIRNAANADFDIAILYGDEIFWWQTFSSIYWGSYSGNHVLLNITTNMTAVLISNKDGQIIRKEYLFQNNTDNYFYLMVSYKQGFWNFLMVAVKILLAIVVVFVFFLIFATGILLCLKVCQCIFSIVFGCAQYVWRTCGSLLSSIRLYINELPTGNTRGFPHDVCVICQENYIKGEILRVLPCSHAYHKCCLDPWLMQNRGTCPLCLSGVHLCDTICRSYSYSRSTSVTESTPLLPPPNSGDTKADWGIFAWLRTFGKQPCRPGTQSPSAINQVDVTRDNTNSIESNNITIIFPSTAGSINTAYEDNANSIRPKSI